MPSKVDAHGMGTAWSLSMFSAMSVENILLYVLEAYTDCRTLPLVFHNDILPYHLPYEDNHYS